MWSELAGKMPYTGETAGGTPIWIVVAVAALVVAGLLFLLFRRGSIADRARHDDADSSEPPEQVED